MQKQIKFKRNLVILTLGLLSAIGPFSIDMYLPGFPDMARSLNTSVSHISMSLSSYFIGISIGQLVYGPLLDRYGRKLPLYGGLVIYILTSLACAMASSADSLIVLRFFQALGSCVGMVASRALVRDLFPVDENAKIFSLLMLVIAISPILAPTAGGYMSAHLGWGAIFISLAFIGVITLLASWFWLPEGQKPDPNKSLKPKRVLKDFVEVSKIPMFFTFALVSALASSGLYSYIASSPSVFMGIYGVGEKQYGWIFAIIAMGLITSSQLNNLLLRKYSSHRITFVALTIQVSVGFVLMMFSLFDALSLYSTIAFIWFFLAMQGFVFPNTSAMALRPFDKGAGTASALMGAAQLGIGAIVTAIVGVASTTSTTPMTLLMFISSISAYIMLISKGKNIKI